MREENDLTSPCAVFYQQALSTRCSPANWRPRYLRMSHLSQIFTEIFLPHLHRNSNSFFVTTHATIMKAMPLNVYRSSWIPGVGAI